ncbi:hypothetical protein M1512_02375 [Patescibacteria group bacterium]|nr:hypothetical protein [Patescibacteria group bacterium]
MKTRQQIPSQSLTIGVGSIEPAPHIAKAEYDWTLIEQLHSDILDSPDVLFKPAEINMPVQCADGRTLKAIGGSAIGGSFTAVMADCLGDRRFYIPGDNSYEHALKVYGYIVEQDFMIGGHDDDHAISPDCGCGGEDKLDSLSDESMSILRFVSENGASIKQTLENLLDDSTGANLGIKVDSSLHATIVDQARELHALSGTDKPYVSSGRDLRRAMIEVGGPDSVDHLSGEHKEVMAIIDCRTDSILDRAALAERYAGLVQAFYINVASIKFAAEVLSAGNLQAAELNFMAGLYYNIAASAVLAGPSLRLLTLT